MMIYCLRERDIEMFVVSVEAVATKPIIRRKWYPTGVRALHMIGEVFDKRKLIQTGELWVFQIEGSPHRIRLQDVECTETQLFDVPMPRTNRRGTVVWKDGRWWVRTRGPDELLGVPNLLEFARI